MKILFILSGNISTTPRAFQSIITAQKHHSVTVLGIDRSHIWSKIDKGIIKQNKLDYFSVSLGRKPLLKWLFCTIVHFVSTGLYEAFKKNLKISAYASSKASVLLVNKLKNYNNDFDLIIGYSYGSIFPVYDFARKRKIPFVIDVEDYYPGEKCHAKEKYRREMILKLLLPKAGFVTFSSQGIKEETEKLAGIKYPESHVIVNSFPAEEFSSPQIVDSEKLRMIWFSQNINYGRGLEEFLQAADSFSDKIEIVLVGNTDDEFYTEYLKNRSFISVMPPMPRKNLHHLLSEFDIGLALEISSVDLNKDIALSNKIFAYAQAGLYILATNTKGQKAFLESNKCDGLLCSQTTGSMRSSIQKLIEQKPEIRIGTKKRYNNASSISWEYQALTLLDIWKNI
jgi:glycosyltransferase involved in cell wall biosynthesis